MEPFRTRTNAFWNSCLKIYSHGIMSCFIHLRCKFFRSNHSNSSFTSPVDLPLQLEQIVTHPPCVDHFERSPPTAERYPCECRRSFATGHRPERVCPFSSERAIFYCPLPGSVDRVESMAYQMDDSCFSHFLRIGHYLIKMDSPETATCQRP